MKPEKLKILKRKTLKMLPISQVELYKNINISSQDASRVVQALLTENLITRQRVVHNSRITYMLERPERIKKLEYKPEFKGLIHNTRFSPCTGCPTDSCLPQTCVKLETWIL
jgi:CTP-dependent riboflavin kinase